MEHEITVRLNTEAMDDFVRKIEESGSSVNVGGGSSPRQQKARSPEEMYWKNLSQYGTAITRNRLEDAKRESRNIIDGIRARQKEKNEALKMESVYKKYRQTLTGVLIELHWLRIVGQHSRVVSASFQMVTNALGYLVDTLLMQFLPSVMALVKFIMDVAAWFNRNPAWKKVFGIITAFAVVLGTVIFTLTTTAWALRSFTAALNSATASLGIKAGAGAAGVGAGGLLAGVAAPVGVGILAGLTLRELYKSNIKGKNKLLDKFAQGGIPFAEGGIVTGATNAVVGEAGPEAILPLDKIGEFVGGLGGFISGVFSNVFKGAAGGGGTGAGVGLSMNDSVRGILVKGFSNVTQVTSGGFKTSNMLVAAILASMGGKGGTGGTPVPTPVNASDIWKLVITPVEVLATELWNLLVTTVDVLSDTLWHLTTVLADVVSTQLWNLVVTPVSVLAHALWGLEITSVPVNAHDLWNLIISPITVPMPTPNPMPNPLPTTTPTSTPGGGGATYPIRDANGNVIGTGYYQVNEQGAPIGPNVPAPSDEGTRTDTSKYWTYLASEPITNASAAVAETVVETTQTSFVDTLVNSAAAIGNTIYSTVSGFVGDVVTSVSDAVGSVISGVGSAINVVNTLTGGGTLNDLFGGLGNIITNLPGRNLPTIPAIIGSFQTGGLIPETGLAYVHKGEEVIPAGKTESSGTTIIINSPTFQISGRNDRDMFDNFMRLMKQESARVR